LAKIESPSDVGDLYCRQWVGIGKIITKAEYSKWIEVLDKTILQKLYREWLFNEEPVIVLIGPHVDELGTYETYKMLTKEHITFGNMNW